eukprot:9288054-Pyramimonas_sp.AAC.1
MVLRICCRCPIGTPSHCKLCWASSRAAKCSSRASHGSSRLRCCRSWTARRHICHLMYIAELPACTCDNKQQSESLEVRPQEAGPPSCPARGRVPCRVFTCTSSVGDPVWHQPERLQDHGDPRGVPPARDGAPGPDGVPPERLGVEEREQVLVEHAVGALRRGEVEPAEHQEPEHRVARPRLQENRDSSQSTAVHWTNGGDAVGPQL